jgi:hypothetical protein
MTIAELVGVVLIGTTASAPSATTAFTTGIGSELAAFIRY